MNDEDFARHVFARAVDDEPPALPSLDRITTNGRRAARNRKGVYAAGAAALASAATAGVVTAPLWNSSTPASTATGRAGQSSTSSPTSPSSLLRGSPIAECNGELGIDLSAIVRPYLPPGATIDGSGPTLCGPVDAEPNFGFEFGINNGAAVMLVKVSAADAVDPKFWPAPTLSTAGTLQRDVLDKLAVERHVLAQEEAVHFASQVLPQAEARPSRASQSPADITGVLAGQTQCSQTQSGLTTCTTGLSHGTSAATVVNVFSTQPMTRVDVVVAAASATACSSQHNPEAALCLLLDPNELSPLAQHIATRF